VVALGTDGAAPGHTAQLPLTLLNSTNLAGLQLELEFNPLFVRTNSFAVQPAASGYLADGAVAPGNHFRVVLLSTNAQPLPNGVLALLTFGAQTNAPNGLTGVPFGSPTIGVSTGGVCGVGMNLQAGQLLVGDAFGFTPGGGRVQFRAADGTNYLFQATTNLTTWTDLGTNLGLNGLVFWFDTDATNYRYRFYRVKAP
jgi:hypothetical protein